MEIKTKPVYEIIDNFLSKEDHYRIKKDLENRNFEWYFSTKSGHPEEHEELYNWQYFHTMYYHQGGYKSRLFPIVQPLITKLKPMILIRIKVNATMYDKKIIEYPIHVDTNIKCKTGIYIIDTSDGYTYFKDGQRIDSIANTFISFDSHHEHAGTNLTSAKRRIVVNINYMQDEILNEKKIWSKYEKDVQT